MNKYIFALGRIATISIAELCNVMKIIFPSKLESEKLLFKKLNKNWLLIETPSEINNPQELLNRLGGSTKIIHVEKENIQAKELSKQIASLAFTTFNGQTSKVNYAISIYNLTNSPNKILKNCLIETKKRLKAGRIPNRFINNNFKNPSTALILGEKIMQKGGEFCAIELDQKKWIIGKSIAIQDINAYSKRDYERPERDPRQGMLPPKLAQILLNLSGVQSGETIYDPFCGIGTVLQEALLTKINIIGSDINPENISKTRKNLDWLKTDFITNEKQKTANPNKSFENISKIKIQLFNKDATNIHKSDLPIPPKAIVTETFLGPPLKKLPSINKIKSNLDEIENLITKFLKNIHPLLSTNTCIVMTIICYKNGSQFIHLDNLIKSLHKLGYERKEIFSQEILQELNLPIQNRHSLIYDRPDQIVAREIIALKPISKDK